MKLELPKKLTHKTAIRSGEAIAVVKRIGVRNRNGELVYRLLHSSGMLGNGEYTRDDLARTCEMVPPAQQQRVCNRILKAYAKRRSERVVKPFPKDLKRKGKWLEEPDDNDASTPPEEATVQPSDCPEERARRLLGIGA